MDLEALVGTDGGCEERAMADGVAAFGRTLLAIRNAGCAVIAAIDGAVLGGGVGIASACDLVVATQSSTFGLPEALFGLIPAVVLPALLERIPAQKARLLTLTAHARTAKEAHELGLVDVLISDDQLEAAVRRAVRSLRRVQPSAARALKRHSENVAAVSFAEGIRMGVDETTRTLGRPEILASVREFISGFEGGAAPWA
jgi:polyketide biosynthesis enoyl-CoA hydratase PksH